MNLFQQTIASEVAKELPWMPPSGPELTELHSENGFHIFGFSLHTLEGESIGVNFIVVALDFVVNPSRRASFSDSHLNARMMDLPIEGDKSYLVLEARRENDFAFWLCVPESHVEKFNKLMRFLRAWSRKHGGIREDLPEDAPDFYHWRPEFQIDEKTNKIVGAMSFKACLRSYYGARVLRECWEKVFAEGCPTEFTMGFAKYTEGLPFIRPDGKRVHLPPDQAIRHPSLRNLSSEWSELGALISAVREGEPARLSHWVPKQAELGQADEKLASFCSNVFRLVHIAHRYLDATFTCDFGSSLTASNVDVEGWVYDLETFRSSHPIKDENNNLPIFGDDVPSEDQLEDLVLALELLQLLCSMLTVNPSSSNVYQLAYQHYTGRVLCPDAIGELISLSDSVSICRKLAKLMYKDALWRNE